MILEAPKHECGVLGIFSKDKPVSQDLFYGLIALQNRGQEGSGIGVFTDDGQIRLHKERGLVHAVFGERDIDWLAGRIGIGHNRYGTTGSSSKENTQPYIISSDLGPFIIGHNGNVFNADELRKRLEFEGMKFTSTSDSEVIAQLIATSPGDTFVEKIKTAAPQLRGAYSLVLATKDSLVGVRDSHGIWPLSLGRINGTGYILASETNALDKTGSKFIEDVAPGTIITIDQTGVQHDNLDRKQEALCSFEFYYFSDPASKLLGKRVENARFEMGKLLAREHPLDVDWVLPIPETARPAAEGYSCASKIPVRGALIRNRWLGRTFIEPSQRLREQAAELKYTPLAEIINGQRIVVIDDSIVRGTTTRRIVRLLKGAGASEVNVLITAPPIIRECWFGVDTADQTELIAAQFQGKVDEIKQFIEADYLGYLSLEFGLQAIGPALKNRVCTSCFTGSYPMQVPCKRDKFILERQQVTQHA
ncbi:amidophosphoribosyltransferase [Candidatus Daviesbacteria bacterium]|nr:amidophosphoribosyltransferase [Candidatus Daviesbacteria bacterium]